MLVRAPLGYGLSSVIHSGEHCFMKTVASLRILFLDHHSNCDDRNDKYLQSSSSRQSGLCGCSVSGDYDTFLRYSLAGGSTLQGVGFASL